MNNISLRLTGKPEVANVNCCYQAWLLKKEPRRNFDELLRFRRTEIQQLTNRILGQAYPRKSFQQPQAISLKTWTVAGFRWITGKPEIIHNGKARLGGVWIVDETRRLRSKPRSPGQFAQSGCYANCEQKPPVSGWRAPAPRTHLSSARSGCASAVPGWNKHYYFGGAVLSAGAGGMSEFQVSRT